MFKDGFRNKGVILFVVLFSLLIVVILTFAILEIIINQSRLTLNQLTRIQAYYATLAGMNLALENLRTGIWTASGTYTLCCGIGCNVNDCSIPWTVRMIVYNNGTSIDGVGRLINVTTNYTSP